jgi:hypothetical protein
VTFSRRRRFTGGLPAVFRCPAGGRGFAQLGPIRLGHIDAIVVGGFLDIGEGEFSIRVRTPIVWSKRAIAFLRCLASVNGSFRSFGKAKTLSGKSLRSVSSPCFSWGFQVACMLCSMLLDSSQSVDSVGGSSRGPRPRQVNSFGAAIVPVVRLILLAARKIDINYETVRQRSFMPIRCILQRRRIRPKGGTEAQ